MSDEPIRDANGYRNDESPIARGKITQDILNTDWPYKDSKGRHARGINDQPPKNQRPCIVRLVFAADGETVLPGVAVRWNATHVYVRVDDPRVAGRAVWVRARDVKRA